VLVVVESPCNKQQDDRDTHSQTYDYIRTYVYNVQYSTASFLLEVVLCVGLDLIHLACTYDSPTLLYFILLLLLTQTSNTITTTTTTIHSHGLKVRATITTTTKAVV